jgi:hypothetical protein
VDPFHEFEEVSKAIVMHFRKVAKTTRFEGGLLEKWVIDSLLNAAEVHFQLIDQPPCGAA